MHCYWTTSDGTYTYPLHYNAFGHRVKLEPTRNVPRERKDSEAQSQRPWRGIGGANNTQTPPQDIGPIFDSFIRLAKTNVFEYVERHLI